MTDLLRGPSVARSDSVTSSHTLFSNTVANSCLSRSYNVQVKNAVVLEEKNRWHSMESVSARRCNFGHSSTLYNVFLLISVKSIHLIMWCLIESDTFLKEKRKNHRESISRQNCIFGGFSPAKMSAILSSQKSFRTTSTFAFGGRRMRDHHKITEKTV